MNAICKTLNERLLKRFAHVLDNKDPIYLAATFLDPAVACLDVMLCYKAPAKKALLYMVSS